MSHLRIIVYSFECDYKGCTETLDVTPVPSPASQSMVEAARKELGWQHWTRKDGVDLCPTHSGVSG